MHVMLLGRKEGRKEGMPWQNLPPPTWLSSHLGRLFIWAGAPVCISYSTGEYLQPGQNKHRKQKTHNQWEEEICVLFNLHQEDNTCWGGCLILGRRTIILVV